ncbi:hypothetical protein LAZ67_23000009 [Cordylochernes scorpioides]|uniref:Uncharacterized protein n=1 Tax=Cordylochernes scorpioides TaxID=51811 RepID=A0ABY6LS11_9ARAC|nr:hypothetical protein LAZ67_23000009 [Cordylochernes scorpioides]
MQVIETPTCNISKYSGMGKVLRPATPADELNACLKSSVLWQYAMKLWEQEIKKRKEATVEITAASLSLLVYRVSVARSSVSEEASR